MLQTGSFSPYSDKTKQFLKACYSTMLIELGLTWVLLILEFWFCLAILMYFCYCFCFCFLFYEFVWESGICSYWIDFQIDGWNWLFCFYLIVWFSTREQFFMFFFWLTSIVSTGRSIPQYPHNQPSKCSMELCQFSDNQTHFSFQNYPIDWKNA